MRNRRQVRNESDCVARTAIVPSMHNKKTKQLRKVLTDAVHTAFVPYWAGLYT